MRILFISISIVVFFNVQLFACSPVPDIPAQFCYDELETILETEGTYTRFAGLDLFTQCRIENKFPNDLYCAEAIDSIASDLTLIYTTTETGHSCGPELTSPIRPVSKLLLGLCLKKHPLCDEEIAQKNLCESELADKTLDFDNLYTDYANLAQSYSNLNKSVSVLNTDNSSAISAINEKFVNLNQAYRNLAEDYERIKKKNRKLRKRLRKLK